jgi:FeS assembly SUF system protein
MPFQSISVSHSSLQSTEPQHTRESIAIAPKAPETMAESAPSPSPMASEEAIVEALKTVHDPEIPVDIYELGLIYRIDRQENGHVEILMTLTSPLCPVAGSLPFEVQKAVEGVDGVTEANVELTFEPPWTKDRMSDVAKLELDLF